MLNRRLFFWAALTAVLLLSAYEWYWGVQRHWPKGHDLESLDVWADQRARVPDLDQQDVIILGSSRAHFNINVHRWDSLTGRRPLQLAYPGSSPLHPIEDIVQQTDFDGLLVIGVAPGLFYTVAGTWPANRGKAFVDRFHQRTYAQRFNQWVYDFIDPHFSFLNKEISYEALIDRLEIPNRDSIDQPLVWPPMVSMDRYRNIRMLPIMEKDTAHQRRQKRIWFNPEPKNRAADTIAAIMEHYGELFQTFQARGGRVVFFNGPITGYYLKNEPKLWPRTEYWDRLLEVCNCPGYHYADHPETKAMIPPEWSHLNRKDADRFTEILIDHLRQDSLL